MACRSEKVIPREGVSVAEGPAGERSDANPRCYGSDGVHQTWRQEEVTSLRLARYCPQV